MKGLPEGVSDKWQAGMPSKANPEMDAAYATASSIRRSGFIAQEVEVAAAKSGYDFSGIIKPKTAKEHYGLSYESFVVPLVKAVQEQQQIIHSQNKRLDEQDRKIDLLIQELKELKKKKTD